MLEGESQAAEFWIYVHQEKNNQSAPRLFGENYFYPSLNPSPLCKGC